MDEYEDDELSRSLNPPRLKLLTRASFYGMDTREVSLAHGRPIDSHRLLTGLGCRTNTRDLQALRPRYVYLIQVDWTRLRRNSPVLTHPL